MKILFVDDNQEIREALAPMLEGRGHQVTVISNPEEVLGLLAQQEFDLLLTDHGMPQMNGNVLTRKVRAKFPALRIWMASASADPSVEECFYDNGGDRYAVKMDCAEWANDLGGDHEFS